MARSARPGAGDRTGTHGDRPGYAAEAQQGSRDRWREAAVRLDDWMRARDYAGHDPHDFLNSPLVRLLSLRSRWLAAAWTQLGKRSPVQLRPLIGAPARRNAKGIGLVVSAHARLFRATGSERFRTGARSLVEWLASNAAVKGPGSGWGYPFPWANRDFFAPPGTPSGVATAFIGHALLDAAETFGWADAAELALGAGEFLLRGLNRIPGPGGTFCFSYTPLDRRAVHNANLLAASLLARLAARGGPAELAETALAAAGFSVGAQRPDGAWPYGAGARNAWVDSFHTSYTLVALHGIRRHLGTTEHEGALERGIAYWRRSFFDGPAVGFYANAPYPIDLHAVAHSIVALIALRERIPDAVAAAERLAEWSLGEMRDSRGYFYYQKHRSYRNRLPYMRWIQSWMLLALADLATAAVAAPEDRPAGVR